MRTPILLTVATSMTACALLTPLDDLGGKDAASDGAFDAPAEASKDAALDAEAEAGPPPCGAPGEACCKAPLAPCDDDGLKCTGDVCMVSDAWAVGTYKTFSSSQGVVAQIVTAHYDGSAWTLQKPVNTDFSLTSSDAVDIYQNGTDVRVIANEVDVGSMYRWNSLNWVQCKGGGSCTGPNPSSTSLWAITSVLNNGSVDYWVAGSSLMDLCADGASTCTSKATGITGSWGTGNFAGQTEQDLWYSVFDHVIHFDGTAWSAMTVADARTINDVGTNDLWIGDKQLRHYDGTAWSNAYLVDGAQTPGNIVSISGAASNDVFAVGFNFNDQTSFAAHWDGTTWKLTPLPAGIATVQKVWAPSRVEAFVAGAEAPSSNTGVIAHWNGTTWSTMTTPAVTFTGEDQPGSLIWVSVTGRARPRRK